MRDALYRSTTPQSSQGASAEFHPSPEHLSQVSSKSPLQYTSGKGYSEYAETEGLWETKTVQKVCHALNKTPVVRPVGRNSKAIVIIFPDCAYKVFQDNDAFDEELASYVFLSDHVSEIIPTFKSESIETFENGTREVFQAIKFPVLQRLHSSHLTTEKESLKKEITDVLEKLWAKKRAHNDIFVKEAAKKWVHLSNFMRDETKGIVLIDLEHMSENGIPEEQQNWKEAEMPPPSTVKHSTQSRVFKADDTVGDPDDLAKAVQTLFM